MYRTLTLLFVLCLAPVAVAQPPAPIAEQPLPNENSTEERLIQFSFDKADWEDVIPWFAEQAGYSWQKISEWPKDTFTLLDDRKYTPIGALDQLNYALRLRKPAYTIVRNRNQLILTEASQPLPDELIETVAPSQLDQRGDYEIVRCKFSLGGINVNTVEQDLRLSISQQYQRFIKVLPTTNEFYARETGANLRKVRDSINAMTKRKTVSTHSLNHYDPEQFLIVARPLLEMQPGAYEREDGSFVISIDPTSNRMILKGTSTAIEEFKSIAKVVDVAANEVELNTERPYLQSYPVFTDPEVAFKVVQTMLDGTDATVGQDTGTGAIVLRGRKDQHKIASNAITTLGGESGTTKIIQLENTGASTILSAVQSLMSSGANLENPSGPKLLANTVQNYIVIRGTPAEINDVTQMIAQLDKASLLDPNRSRSSTRILKMSPGKRDDLLEAAEDYMRSTGRRNPMRIIMPEDRKKPIGDLKRFRSPGSDSKEMLTPPSAKPNDGTQTSRTASQRSALATSELMSFALTGLVAYQSQDDADGNEDQTPSNEMSSSVAGSPIVIKGTPFGILLESDDLDALDDLERLLALEAGEEGTDQGLTFFYLKYQKASSIKSELDNMFGLGGGGGGGGGLGGDLLSGIVGNVAGEGAGDLLGGVLGGGESVSSSGAVISLEGDVQIGMYVPHNLLYISGATQSDLEIIQESIEIFDQPSPPQDPELAGQFYSIQIQHRDPQYILERIQILMADYIESTEQAPPQQQGGNAQEQVARAVRNMAGGRNGGRNGGGNNGGSNSEPELPKIRLDLDKQTDQILLTGPEFIYRQVKAIVEKIDTPQLDKPKTHRVLSSGVTEGMLKIIQERFGKIEMVDETDETEGTPASQSGNQATGQNNRSAQGAANNERRQRQEGIEALRNLRNQAQAGQRGGGQRGGANRGGGGGVQRGGAR